MYYFIGKEIPPKKHANICLLSLFFALNIYKVHIKVSVDVLLHSCFEKAFLNDGKRKKQTTLHLFSVTKRNVNNPQKFPF